MKSQTISLRLIFLLVFATQSSGIYRLAQASKPKIHITDELEDVADDEEDDAWRQWGKPTTQPDFDPPPADFTNMRLHEMMQEEMMKRQLGPVFGFVKLRPGNTRTPEIVSEIAMKWTNVARTGGVEVKFMGVDVSTVMFTMQKGQDTLELKEFLLDQSDAYEIKIGDQLFRRSGDPPFDEVLEKLRADKGISYDADIIKDDERDEL